MTVSLDLKVVYRDKDEVVSKQTNFSAYSSPANLYYDYPFVITSSTSVTLFSYVSPTNIIFPSGADLLVVKNRGQAEVGVTYTNKEGQTISVALRADRLAILADVDITCEIILTNTTAYSGDVDVFLAGR